MVRQAAKERRNWIRAKRVLSIQYRLAQSQRRSINRTWHLSMTEDMSPAGLSFYTNCEYHVNDVLEIQVIMSGLLELYKGFGKIVRIERKSMGVCYLVAIKFVERKTRSKSVLKPRSRSKRKSRLISKKRI